MKMPCPHCFAILSSSQPVPPGSTAKCSKCGGSFKVPGRASATPSAPTSAPSAGNAAVQAVPARLKSAPAATLSQLVPPQNSARSSEIPVVREVRAGGRSSPESEPIVEIDEEPLSAIGTEPSGGPDKTLIAAIATCSLGLVALVGAVGWLLLSRP
jgi:hypothetical protein